jgi:dolichyl-phosphate beta-glucosyltransferase
LVKKQLQNLDGFRILVNPHGGKPSALWFGIKAAKGKFLLLTDMDQSTSIRELDKLLPYIKDYKAVIGSRGYSRKSFPFYRRLGSFIFTTLRKAIILPEINDTQCGFKIIDRSVALKYFPEIDYFKKEQNVKGWKVTSWDVEFLYILKIRGIKIKEVLVNWMDVNTSKSKGGLMRYFQ